MALQQPLAKALTCQGCQRWLLRSFMAATAGPCLRSTSPLQTQRRHISESDRIFDRIRKPPSNFSMDDDFLLNDINGTVERMSHSPPEQPQNEPKKIQLTEDVIGESTAVGSQTQEHIPWYLQVQQPILEQSDHNPLAARQRIPDLPDCPPPLLQPLLGHVSVELGMDDLTILDLRSLDPPPALGANLLMIVGTARSEKHLHVSADRLCRWLRSTYKLRPYADGLLGRNELKLKMRRKAKRSRLLSAVGAKATADSEIDDGIRTGWVCVNVGRVEGGELPKREEDVRREEGVVGFGSQTTGSNIVVQMMTEEKRGEIDLENLWSEELDRAMRRKASINDATSDGEPSHGDLQRTSATREGDSSASLALNEGLTIPFHPGTHQPDTDGVQLRV